MPSIKEHCDDCIRELGKPYKEVHEWLDEYAKIYFPLMIHRIHRHHIEGIQEVKEKWGEEAAKAAEIHIRQDEGDLFHKEDIEKRYGVNWSLFGPDIIDDKGSEFLTDEK